MCPPNSYTFLTENSSYSSLGWQARVKQFVEINTELSEPECKLRSTNLRKKKKNLFNNVDSALLNSKMFFIYALNIYQGWQMGFIQPVAL